MKEDIVEQREFENIRLVKEYVAEFRYSPTKCEKTYRVVVVWKDLEVRQGQRKLFDNDPLLLLHHQRLEKFCGGNRRASQRPL